MANEIQNAWMDQFTPTAMDTLYRELSRHVSSAIEHDVTITPFITLQRDDTRAIAVETINLAQDIKIKIFESLHIYVFNSGYNSHKNVYCLNMHYRFTNFDGGSNGTKICDIYINEKGEVVLMLDAKQNVLYLDNMHEHLVH